MEPFIGEIRLVGFNFAPQGWAFCNGQIMAIDQNTALFALIGTTYGGDGQTTFALPDLRGRVAVHQGTSAIGSPYVIGELTGSENVSLTGQQVPQHNHSLVASSNLGTAGSPTGKVLASAPLGLGNVYAAPTSIVSTAMSTLPAGSGTAHDNLMPFLVMNYIISLFGVFPSQN